MTVEEAKTALGNNVKVKHEEGQSMWFFDSIAPSQSLGSFSVKEGRIDELKMEFSYFNAFGMPIAEIAQTMAKSYSILGMQWEAPCRTVTAIKPIVTWVPDYGCYVGATENKELIIIEDYAKGFAFGSLVIVQPYSGAPTFD